MAALRTWIRRPTPPCLPTWTGPLPQQYARKSSLFEDTVPLPSPEPLPTYGPIRRPSLSLFSRNYSISSATSSSSSSSSSSTSAFNPAPRKPSVSASRKSSLSASVSASAPTSHSYSSALNPSASSFTFRTDLFTPPESPTPTILLNGEDAAEMDPGSSTKRSASAYYLGIVAAQRSAKRRSQMQARGS